MVEQGNIENKDCQTRRNLKLFDCLLTNGESKGLN